MTVFTNEVIEQARQFVKGFIVNEDTLSLEEIKKIGAGGSFIASRRTMNLFRQAYHTSSIFPRLSLEKWQELGSPEAIKYLREHTMDLLEHPIFPADQQDLLKKGVKFNYPLQTLNKEHIKIAYFKDPDGITLEIVGTSGL